MPLIFLSTFFFLANLMAVTSPESWEKLWVQAGCTLENNSKIKKAFPGAMCIFQDDGTFISASESAMRKFSKNREILWEIPGHHHHQMNLSTDKQKILVFSSDILQIEGAKRRIDVVLIIDQSGKIIAQTDSEKIMKLAGLKPIPLKIPVINSDHETSHFNSVYEIPSHQREKEIPWLKSGNIILNSLHIGFFVMSPDLKTLIHHSKIVTSSNHSVHDLQVTSRGDFLYFNNHLDSHSGPYSSIHIVDPKTKKLFFEFTTEPKVMFFTSGGGSVQEIGDYLFFNHTLTGAYLYSKKTRKIVKSFPRENDGPGTITWVQQMKLVDADSFLRNFN